MRTKRIPGIMVVSLFLIGLLGACGSRNAADVPSVSDVQDNAVSETVPQEAVPEEEAAMNTGSGSEHPVPQELAIIPQEYFQAADQQGTLVELTYNTYESKTYEQKSEVLTKRAIVYLPYGYSGDNKYNVFYLMHGGWSNETTPLGTPNNPNSFKNVIDHAIENGEVEPLIIVCPTYNNESPEDSGDYTLAFNTLTVNYHNELVNDLIPAVEGTYSTYAESTSPEAIKNSRDHRAFGGFSMGSVTTWYTFVNCLDEFRYFLPMSGAMDYEGDDVDAAVTASGHSPDDFFIYAITGTDDFEYGHFTSQIEGMLGMSSGNFISADSEVSGNIAFRIKDGYSHSGQAAMEYTYNGLMWFWN
jgi:enterochelin esterase-like enzyme